MSATFFDSLSQLANSSPLFSGCVMLLMNIGGRYVAMEIPKNVHSILEKPLARKIIIFCIAFVATRNIKAALLLTLVFVLLNSYLLNEKSRCCVLTLGK